MASMFFDVERRARAKAAQLYDIAATTTDPARRRCLLANATALVEGFQTRAERLLLE